MNEVQSYLIISAYDTIELSKDVNKHLNAGWKLVGGVCSTLYTASNGTLNYTFHQALTRTFIYDVDVPL
jgi:hypothetical protein